MTCGDVGTLVLQVQGAFLDCPGLALTVGQASRRFHLDAQTAGAILGLLAEANVLTQRGDDTYARQFPRYRVAGQAA
jgi:hypothetical protein